MRDYGGLTPEEIQAIIEEGKRIEKERQKKKKFQSEPPPQEQSEGAVQDTNTIDSEDADSDEDIYTHDQMLLDEDIAIDDGDNPFDRLPSD